MSIYLETQSAEFEKRAGGLQSRSFFDNEGAAIAINALSSELFRMSAPVRQASFVDFAVHNTLDQENGKLCKLTFRPDTLNHGTQNWQLLFRDNFYQATILDGTVSPRDIAWKHLTLDQQGSLRSHGSIEDPNAQIAGLVLKAFAAERPFNTVEDMIDVKTRLASTVEYVDNLPRKNGKFKKINEAKACLNGIKLFAIGPRSTKFVHVSPNPLGYEALPANVRAVIEDPATMPAIDYRPHDLRKIEKIIEELSD